jgi:hypothetical protein
MLKVVSSFTRLLSESGKQGQDRAIFSAVLISRSLAVSLQLPTSPVTNPYEYFNSAHADTVNSVISAINEAMVINVVEVQRLTREQWVARYRMVYTPTNEDALACLNACLERDGSIFAGDVLSILKSNPTRDVGWAMREFGTVLADELGVGSKPTTDAVVEAVSVEGPKPAIAIQH